MTSDKSLEDRARRARKASLRLAALASLGLGTLLSCIGGCSPATSSNIDRASGASGARAGMAGRAGAAAIGGSTSLVAGTTSPPPTVTTTATNQTIPSVPVAGSAPPPLVTAGSAPPPSAAGSGGSTAPKGPPNSQMALPSGDGKPSMLPAPKGTCEDFKTGVMTFNNIKVQIWAGKPAAAQPGGPLLFYWHGTGTSADEASQGFGQAGIDDVVSKGGIVASFIDTTMQGAVSGGTIWYAGDLDIADQIVACAIQKQNIDVTRIHASGYSAGGLQTGAMVTQRANYIASALIYSGGVIGFGGGMPSSNVPPLMCAHGAMGSDMLGLDFAMACESLETQTTTKGSFAIDCNDGGAHIDILSRFAPAAFGYKFLTTHPYGTKPSPWMSMLPAGAPMDCKIWNGGM